MDVLRVPERRREGQATTKWNDPRRHSWRSNDTTASSPTSCSSRWESMRSKLTESTCNIRRREAKPPARRVEQKQHLWAWAGRRPRCRRDHRSTRPNGASGREMPLPPILLLQFLRPVPLLLSTRRGGVAGYRSREKRKSAHQGTPKHSLRGQPAVVLNSSQNFLTVRNRLVQRFLGLPWLLA